jgi:hypothetical protein
MVNNGGKAGIYCLKTWQKSNLQPIGLVPRSDKVRRSLSSRGKSQVSDY